MQQDICRHGVEQQVEHLGLDARRRTTGSELVGDFGETVALKLKLGLEPEAAGDIVPRKLQAVVGSLSFRPSLFFLTPCRPCGLVRLEEMALAPIVRESERR